MKPGLNWGATAAEQAAVTPADALAPSTAIRADRAITIDAPPAVVFGWLCQLRRAPYSYDLIDNFGRRSPRHIDPALGHLEIGQKFMQLFTLASFTVDQQITLRSKSATVTYAVARVDERLREEEPVPSGTARVDERLREEEPAPSGTALVDERSRLHVRVCFASPRLVATALAVGDLVMMRKQLLTLKSLSERDAVRRTP